MSAKKLIHSATIINEGRIYRASVLIDNQMIEAIFEDCRTSHPRAESVSGEGMHLLPGVIDDQVHFREPGLTYKGEIRTESRAAIAGGVTSLMEMPNTSPQTTSQAALADKYALGAARSWANYSFYMGATNDNIDEILRTDPANVCGIKVFMGSSTGNMLVDSEESLRKIFAQTPMLVATHCEDEARIRARMESYHARYGDEIDMRFHAKIRDDEACYLSSSFAVALAREYNTRLHVLHLSSEKEMSLFDNSLKINEKRITAEVCVHHLWFDSSDYAKHGARIKWNPAIKLATDKEALWAALLDNRLDVIATDHAPHTAQEKANPYFKAPSGGPLVQHSLVAMLEFAQQGKISLTRVVEKMCHAPAEVFRVKKRGYIRPGYYADLVLVNLNRPWTVSPENILYKCAWSPFEGQTFGAQVVSTFVNGVCVYSDGKFTDESAAMRLEFKR